MRILIIANKIPYPPIDGGAIATLNMATGLSQVGADVSVLAINTSKHFFPPENIPLELTTSINLKTVYVDTNISLVRMMLNLLFSCKPYNAVRFINSKFKVALESQLINEVYDVIQLEGLYLTPYIKVIRAHTTATIALRAHNVEHEIWQLTAQQAKNPIKRAYFNILARRIRRMEIAALRKVDIIIPITESDGKQFRHFVPATPQHIAQTGLNANRFSLQPTPPKFPNTIFHIGGLDWLPNQEGLLWFLHNCWPIIRTELPAAQFHIAGRNAPHHFLEQIKHGGVVYDGEVDSAEEYMRDHGVLVIPLLSGSGLRIKIVEGMAAGKAIVSTKIGAEGINADVGKELFIANTPEKMAETCISLLKNPKLAETTGKHANRFANENFNSNTISSRLLDFYQEVALKQKNLSN